MHLRIDVGVTGVRDDEVQAVRRRHALKQMVRSPRVLRARLALRIAERAQRRLLVPGGHAVGRHERAGFLAPRRLGERLGDRGLDHIPGDQRGTAAQKGPAIEKPVARDCYGVCHGTSSHTTLSVIPRPFKLSAKENSMAKTVV